MDLRGAWPSACPALLRYPRRNQVAPTVSANLTQLAQKGLQRLIFYHEQQAKLDVNLNLNRASQFELKL